MFNLQLFKIRAFFMGSAAGLLAAIARGGLQFMLIIWLQGIWLPLHGYNYSDTPLWAGIFLFALDGRLPRRRSDLGFPLGPPRGAHPLHRGD
jgi:hypothetical protein